MILIAAQSQKQQTPDPKVEQKTQSSGLFQEGTGPCFSLLFFLTSGHNEALLPNSSHMFL